MVIVRIQGGLGNQLFQYALYLKLKEIYREVHLDFSWFDKKERDLKLPEFFGKEIIGIDEKFNLKKFGFNDSNIPKYEYSISNYYMRFKKLICIIITKVFKSRCNLNIRINQKYQIYDSSIFKYKKVYLNGYWISEKYFNSKAIKSYLFKKAFSGLSLNKFSWFNHLSQTYNLVSIHFRNGDYVNNKEFGIIDMNYYKVAIEYILRKVDNPYFLIFSDDVKLVSELYQSIIANIKHSYVSNYIDNVSLDIQDMFLMSKCEHNIIVNSTFSWWGAYLNQHTSKIVIAPNRWFHTIKHDISDVLPKKWIQLEF